MTLCGARRRLEMAAEFLGQPWNRNRPQHAAGSGGVGELLAQHLRQPTQVWPASWRAQEARYGLREPAQRR
jgi:hypothetical protein